MPPSENVVWKVIHISNKSVLGIRDDRFGGFSVAVLELFAEPGGRGVYLVGVGGPGGDDLANVLVVAQQSDRQIARRVACHQILVFPYFGLQGPDALLYVGAVVDMDMAHDGFVVLEYVDDRLEQATVGIMGMPIMRPRSR